MSFETIKEEDEDDKSQEIVQEEEIEEEVKEEEREVFVDSSDKVTDETPQSDTEKIGEVGSTAKDMHAEQENMNNEPRLTGESLAMDPEYRTALAPQLADVQVEPQVKTLPPIQEKLENSLQEENVYEEAVESITVETSQEPGEKSGVPEKDETDTSMIAGEAGEKSVENLREGIATADQNGQNEEMDIETSSFDSDVVVPVNIPVQENVKGAENSDEEIVAKDGEEVFEEQEEHVSPQEGSGTLPDEEHTKLVSIPKDMMDHIVKDPHEEKKESMPENVVNPEEQLTTVTPSDNVQAPFFEDDISNAPIQGSESFNIKKHEYAPYYKHIRDKIRLFWLVQYGTDASINLVTKDYKPVVVEFKVLPSGKITDVVISKPAGNDLLASKVQKSVQNTMLNKFPDYVNEKFINVRFNFYFF
ncbi:MAG: TonB C-terminal domain-containing protein [Candidatus Scalindua sp.]|nr:TonB C-terminal domain-containing protein [Candidatus Scalindua sp.]